MARWINLNKDSIDPQHQEFEVHAVTLVREIAVEFRSYLRRVRISDLGDALGLCEGGAYATDNWQRGVGENRRDELGGSKNHLTVSADLVAKRVLFH